MSEFDPSLTPAQESGKECLPGESDEARKVRRCCLVFRNFAFALSDMRPPPKSERFREKIPHVSDEEFWSNLERIYNTYGTTNRKPYAD